MKNILLYLTVWIVACVVFSGCQKEKPNTSLNLVNSVAVDCRHHQKQLQRTYTQTDKIDVILHYLHKLTSLGAPDVDPEQLRSDRCLITVTLSNGQQHTYRLQGTQYLSVDLRPWQTVNIQQASVLYHLISHIPGDISPRSTDPTQKTGSIKSET